MKIRKPKPDDQEQAHHVFSLMVELVKNHPEIEDNIWVSGCLSMIIQSFINSDLTYEECYEDMLKAIKSYKSWWEEE